MHVLNRVVSSALMVCLLGGAAVAAEPAAADETAGRFQLLGKIDIGSDDLNFGFGLRAGFTMPQHLYIGGKVVYFLGESRSAGIPGYVTQSADYSALTISGEVGYDFQVAPHLVIRPYGGLGIFRGSAELCTTEPLTGSTCQTWSDSVSLIEMGGLLNYVRGQWLFGGNVELLFVDMFGDGSDSAFVFGGHAGLLF